MGKESKTLIFIVVVLVVGFLLLRPYIWPAGGDDVEFMTTSDPQAAMDRAFSEGKPIFLEFYSDT